MTDSEYLRVIANDSSLSRANRLRAIADRIEALEKDAARYRWLMEYHWDTLWDWVVHDGNYDSPPCQTPEATEAAIDAAMKAAP